MKQQDQPEISRISLASVFAALGDPVRLGIVQSLALGERWASDFD